MDSIREVNHRSWDKKSSSETCCNKGWAAISRNWEEGYRRGIDDSKVRECLLKRRIREQARSCPYYSQAKVRTWKNALNIACVYSWASESLVLTYPRVATLSQPSYSLTSTRTLLRGHWTSRKIRLTLWSSKSHLKSPRWLKVEAIASNRLKRLRSWR